MILAKRYNSFKRYQQFQNRAVVKWHSYLALPVHAPKRTSRESARKELLESATPTTSMDICSDNHTKYMRHV